MDDKRYKPSKWFLLFIILTSLVVFILQFKPSGYLQKDILIIVLSAVASIILLRFLIYSRLGAWTEKWLKSSYDDFIEEFEKDRKKNKMGKL